MSLDTARLKRAISLVAGIAGVQMDARALTEDVVLVARLWPEGDDFQVAILNTCRALSQLAEGKVEGTPLKYRLFGWNSYHYQHLRAQGSPADMRIIYQRTATGIHVRGFGHRHVPEDFYGRVQRREP